MTEAEWLVSNEPTPMLAFLRGKDGDRKVRLFVAACCRGLGHLMADGRTRLAVETAERHADGCCTLEDLTAGRAEADSAYREARRAGERLRAKTKPLRWAKPRDVNSPEWSRAWAEVHRADVFARQAYLAVRVLEDDVDAYYGHLQGPQEEVAEQIRRMSDLLRDLLGNPFRPVSLDSAWLAWNGGTVQRMAQTIYDEYRFGDLPILADALEDAGCTDADILSHCRSGGEHVRGCWVIDLLLGKS
jgi:hypothetical protein